MDNGVKYVATKPLEEFACNQTCNQLATDCINRQAAIDALWKALYDYEDKTEKQFQDSDELDVGDWMLHRIFVQSMSDIDRQTIIELPSVQPERKTGKWYKPTGMMPPEFSGMYRCSECDELALFDWKHHHQVLSDYCPNCGAKMEELK